MVYREENIAFKSTRNNEESSIAHIAITKYMIDISLVATITFYLLLYFCRDLYDASELNIPIL